MYDGLWKGAVGKVKEINRERNIELMGGYEEMEKQIRNEMAHLIADIMKKQNKANELQEEIKADKKKLESLALAYYTQGKEGK